MPEKHKTRWKRKYGRKRPTQSGNQSSDEKHRTHSSIHWKVLQPGTDAYVAAHGDWQRSRGRQPSCRLQTTAGIISNPKVAYLCAKGLITLEEAFSMIGQPFQRTPKELPAADQCSDQNVTAYQEMMEAIDLNLLRAVLKK